MYIVKIPGGQGKSDNVRNTLVFLYSLFKSSFTDFASSASFVMSTPCLFTFEFTTVHLNAIHCKFN